MNSKKDMTKVEADMNEEKKERALRWINVRRKRKPNWEDSTQNGGEGCASAVLAETDGFCWSATSLESGKGLEGRQGRLLLLYRVSSFLSGSCSPLVSSQHVNKGRAKTLSGK